MFHGLHDSEIVAYAYDARRSELTLTLTPGTGSAVAGFHLVFRGLLVYQFPYPLLPAIVDDLIEVPVDTLLRDQAATLAEGSRRCGWPGPWFSSTQDAAKYCASVGARAYELVSSYGMDGWIIAQSVARGDLDDVGAMLKPNADSTGAEDSASAEQSIGSDSERVRSAQDVGTESCLLAVLDHGDELIRDCVAGRLPFAEFAERYDSLYWSHALDGHESDPAGLAVLAKFAARIAVHRAVAENVLARLCGDEDAAREDYRKAGRIGSTEAIGRLRRIAETL